MIVKVMKGRAKYLVNHFKGPQNQTNTRKLGKLTFFMVNIIEILARQYGLTLNTPNITIT